MKMEARGDRFDLFTFFPSLFAYAGTRPAGYLVYNGSKVNISPEAVDLKFIGAFEYFVGVIAALERALKGSEPQRVSLLRHRPNGMPGENREPAVCRPVPNRCTIPRAGTPAKPVARGLPRRRRLAGKRGYIHEAYCCFYSYGLGAGFATRREARHLAPSSEGVKISSGRPSLGHKLRIGSVGSSINPGRLMAARSMKNTAA